MKPLAIRLQPGQDLKQELIATTQNKKLNAAFVVSCCGSLKNLKIQADSPELAL